MSLPGERETNEVSLVCCLSLCLSAAQFSYLFLMNLSVSPGSRRLVALLLSYFRRASRETGAHFGRARKRLIQLDVSSLLPRYELILRLQPIDFVRACLQSNWRAALSQLRTWSRSISSGSPRPSQTDGQKRPRAPLSKIRVYY